MERKSNPYLEQSGKRFFKEGGLIADHMTMCMECPIAAGYDHIWGRIRHENRRRCQRVGDERSIGGISSVAMMIFAAASIGIIVGR